jgi:thiol:disulfide interchange protein
MLQFLLVASLLAPAGPLLAPAEIEAHAHAALYARAEGTTVRAIVEMKVDDGWHVYSGPDAKDVGSEMGLPTVPVLSGDGFTWGDWRFPEPKVEILDFGDKFEVRTHAKTFAIWRAGTKSAAAKLEDLTLDISGQTCTEGDAGQCIKYEETVKYSGPGPDALFASFPKDLAPTPTSTTPESSKPADATTPASSAMSGEGTSSNAAKSVTTKSAATTSSAPVEEEAGRESSLLAFLVSAVLWGLVALLMPCTYPMIPITISFFTKQADARKTGTLSLSLTYGLGIVLMFVLIGLLAAPVIIPFAANPITNLVIGGFFLVFALTLFGVMNLQPPAFLLRVAGSASQKGGYAGVFLMGAMLVVTSFTCTGPFVGTLLSTAATTGGVGRIALGMGVFGLTMAVPFAFLSMVPAKVKAMPKSGEWMHTLKVYLGFIEVAAALKFISNVDLVWSWGILSRELFLFLWFAIIALAAAYLFGWIRLKDEYGQEDSATISPKRMVAGIGTALFAVYCLYGALGHSMDPVMTAFAPNYSTKIGGFGGGSSDASVSTAPEIIKDDYQAAFARAKATRKLLLVNFTGIT